MYGIDEYINTSKFKEYIWMKRQQKLQKIETFIKGWEN